MKLNSIKISNFRNINNKYDFNNFNIIDDENIFEAIMIGFGSFFKASNLIQGINKNFLKSDINSEIEFDAFSNNEKINWIRKSNSNSKKLTNELNEFVANLDNSRYNNLNSIFPVLAYYNTKNVYYNYNVEMKKEERVSKITLAYKNSFSGNIDFKYAFDWIYCYENQFKYGFEFEGTKDVLYNALYKAIPNLKDIKIDYINSEFMLMFNDSNDYVSYDNLNNDIKLIINIVSDICYRAILLNGFLKEDTLIKTSGIVMINNYTENLNVLTKIFPNIQFIVK